MLRTAKDRKVKEKKGEVEKYLFKFFQHLTWRKYKLEKYWIKK